MATQFHHLAVADVQPLCDDAAAITFAVPLPLSAKYAFHAGQTLTIGRVIDGQEERRSYSICAQEGHAPRIGVREVPNGLLSRWLVRDLRPGDHVKVSSPTGTFTPDAASGARHALIAAGSGITPMMSIATTVLANPDSSVALLYGNRRTDTVMFAEELADLKDRYPTRLELMHVLSREPREAEIFTGRLNVEKMRSLLGLLDPADVDHWWLCGPFEMVVALREFLASIGIPADKVRQELFYVDDSPPPAYHHVDAASTAATSEVTVILDGRSTTMPVDYDTSILDGAGRVRPDLPFACKGGVCGTCRARVTDGKVHMRRNYALEPTEVAAGFVLTCQSTPQSNHATIDFDS